MSDTLPGKTVDRRSFLRGSAVFATAFGLTVLPALAQQPQQQPPPPQEPKPEEKPKPEEQPKPEEKKPAPQDPFAQDEKNKGKLIDKEGREYRVCPQCAYNMYKQGRMWVCENCGYSYVE
jgi:hypothetical protein